MKVTAIWQAAHQKRCAEAVCAGLRKHGHEVKIVNNPVNIDTEAVACWGWRQGQVWRKRGFEVLVMERAYLGDRFQWYSLAWNGLNNRGKFPWVRNDGGARFRQHFGHLVKPWKKDGRYILLAGQVPGDMSLQGRNLNGWYANMALALEATHRRQVQFREHPEAAKRGVRREPNYTVKSPDVSLEQALAGAYLCVTFNSNTGVEAVLAGVPTMAADIGSMAWDVATHSPYEQPIKPEREKWLADLAWKQFKLDEIALGAPFDA